MLAPSTIFNTAASFLTNTNLQHYSGEVHLSYFSQVVFVGWKQFVGPSVGLAVLIAILRALRGDASVGNFYLDLYRGVVLVFFAVSLVLCVVVYPLALLAFAQAVPGSAKGSIVDGPDGQPVGSRHIAQAFANEKYFQPRPSAVDYNAAGSGGSNLGASNPKLRERVVETLKGRTEASVPADAVTTSGSGLDPHITRANADGQRDRVKAAWAKQLDPAKVKTEVTAALDAATFRPLGGLVGGDPLVNVLELNLDLTKRLAGR